MEKVKRGFREKADKAWRVTSYAAGYGFGGGVGQVISLYYMNFLIYAMHLSFLQVGVIMAISKVWDGFIDPVIGVLVDRTKTRWGSCRPWILASVVPIFISYFMLWNSFGINNITAKFFYFLFTQILFSTAASIGGIPYSALLPRMVDSYNERTAYSSFRLVFSGITAIASTYIYEAMIPAKTLSDYAGLTGNFTAMGLVLGIVFAVPYLITFIGSREKATSFKPERLTLKKVFKNYAEVLKSKLYRKCFSLLLITTFVGCAISVSMVIFLLMIYGNPSFGVLSMSFTFTFLIVNIKGAVEILFFVPNVIMMRKYNKHRPLFIDLPLLAIGCIILLFITSSTPIYVCFIGAAFIGAGSSCLFFVPPSLMPDLTDVDEMLFGKRREGASAGLVALCSQLVSGLSYFVFGLILTLFGLSETEASPGEATPAGIAAVKLMLCGIPILGCIAMVIVSKTYNLDAKSHALIKNRIAEKREKGYAETTDDEKALFASITGVPYEKMWVAEARESAEKEYGSGL